MAANSSLLSSVCSLLPAWVALRNLNTALYSGHSWPACCPQSRLQTGMCVTFGKPQGCGQGPHWLGHNVYLHQPAEQGCDWGPPQGQVQVPWQPEAPLLQEGGFSNFNADEVENIWKHGGRKVVHLRWLWGQIYPYSWPSGPMVGPALMRALALSPPYSCP